VTEGILLKQVRMGRNNSIPKVILLNKDPIPRKISSYFQLKKNHFSKIHRNIYVIKR
jgi:hypothetical protein